MKKHRVVIDITSVASVSFISGIQRVAREIVVRLLKWEEVAPVEIVLLTYDTLRTEFRHVPSSLFLGYLCKEVKQRKLFAGDWFRLEDLTEADIFFDIDSVWNDRMRRSFLLPRLKRQGVRIAVFIQDIIPVLFPQYCDRETAMRFMDFLGAYLLNADVIFASSESAKADMQDLARELGLPEKSFVIAPLGADFDRERMAAVLPESEAILALKDSCYLFLIGTIEPRKNYDFILDVYEERLRSLGFRLVIAGRPGWNVDALMDRIQRLRKTDKDFVYLQGADDRTVNFLYEHAFFTVFPTHYEGYGLPVVESFLHGTPVLATDIKVLREVGGDRGEYFTAGDADSLVERLVYYRDHPEEYRAKKASLAEFRPVTWEDSEKAVRSGLETVLESNTKIR